MKDGLFYRPHPVVWRTVMGAGVLYLCTLVFFLFQVSKKFLFFFPPKKSKKNFH